MTMKPALLHGYIICDSDGWCQDYTLSTNRAQCWETFLSKIGYTRMDEQPKQRRRLKRQGFRAARVWVKDAEVKPLDAVQQKAWAENYKRAEENAADEVES